MEGRGPLEGFSGAKPALPSDRKVGEEHTLQPRGWALALTSGDVWAGFLEPQAAPVQPGAKRSPSDVCVRS